MIEGAMPVSQSGVLKRCPFCGGAALVWHAFPAFDEGWCIAVEHGRECHDRGWEGYCYSTEAEATSAWNTRTTQPTDLT